MVSKCFKTFLVNDETNNFQAFLGQFQKKSLILRIKNIKKLTN